MNMNSQSSKLLNGAESAEAMVASFQAQINDSTKDFSTKDMTMFAWTLEQLRESTDGEFIGPVSEADTIRFTSISTDTRTLQPGALYIAIKGDNFDGHTFIEQAVQQGAVAVLVSETVESIVPGVEVDDTRIALGQFARWHRQQMPVKTLVAVTGSNGKTTTKTLLNSLFSQVGNTLATEGNLNNDFGVPRTLLNIRPEHEFAIIEMGANHPHEIAYLTALALPDIAMINNASGAHLEGFGSLQGVINTKGEIFQGLNQIPGRNPGIAVINTDSPGFTDWQQRLQKLAVTKVVTFGSKASAQFRVEHFKTLDSVASGIEFELDFSDQKHLVTMPVLGFHNAMNAAACVAVAISAGLSWQQILPGLVSFSGVSGRLQKTAINNGWLIDDSYNANPESVKAGIDALCSLPGQAVVCLGAMAEIGVGSAQAHREIAEYARDRGVYRLFVYGEAAKNMPDAFGENSQFFNTHEAMAQTVVATITSAAESQQKMNVLVKGSRSAKMEKVSQAILNALLA
ncbi:UDP-N-acetylmuramoyl-tripeptide--D-alanyl-D-alanine ligase [Thiomicrorhabdus immobilis]|uniref:UDP-N-acetylmuramoyl-tripeptide--D-alanyl-D-alanine ligase n=1 Tax=Thiomicrorhabdus immobilis TaxID=2791037 RepID=A0ABM7MEM9_9GAMM|nr:UDP-N-acetylmuramoyl-tripeptide--D-alanyl-D-alanine ligase [Thiomicrorhabdus immobilis]BCN93872.1 UDP-N-acetylmuramoyl-tripeptide--D-alanyl-D-alanine ligase [Thiomicrorhabdus immobilis]